MTAAVVIQRRSRADLIVLAGVIVSAAAVVVQIDFMTRPGLADTLGGLAHHAFVLCLLLVVTARSRTVSLGMLGIFWLLGVWGVFELAYFVERQSSDIFGVDAAGYFFPVWMAPFIEESMKALPVLLYFVLAGRGGYRHPAATDGLLLGFMIGAGVSFHEDAHVGQILVSGDGWSAAKPWTAIFPTISPIGDGIFALNHALWAALSGLAIGVAMTLRHWRWAWALAVFGPLFAVTNHIMSNYFTSFTNLLLNRGNVPGKFDTIRDLTNAGRIPIGFLVGAAILVAAGEWWALRWVGRRERMLPAVGLRRYAGLVARSLSKSGAAELLAGERYLLLRRRLYFQGWRAAHAGAVPSITDADIAELRSLWLRAGLAAEAAPVVPLPPAAAATGSTVEAPGGLVVPAEPNAPLIPGD